jgi:hypothetical protein
VQETGTEGAVGNASSGGEVGSVDAFLLDALNSPRDRLTILKLELELEKFLRDPKYVPYI